MIHERKFFSILLFVCHVSESLLHEFSPSRSFNRLTCIIVHYPKLTEPFRITRFVYPSPIPNSIDDTLAQTKFPICTVVGWGRLKPGSDVGYGDVLRKVRVPLITVEKCRHQVYSGVRRDSQLCAGVDEGGIDSCQGDSGGPMLCDNVQVGVVSWGIGCGNKKSPGIYSRVDYYLDWINSTVTRNTSGRYSHQVKDLDSQNYGALVLEVKIHQVEDLDS
ncbi:trypsin-3-like [Neodiprion lecontei]|uniref:Trypsin-3-like n=1 Tax=Neodiprion lecontei TaxID=441921 RepID=A0ABM3FQK2_NEOLC|nr:trypsin-3-like [Neodiprion lecontei]